jgi:hypothetical protein
MQKRAAASAGQAGFFASKGASRPLDPGGERLAPRRPRQGCSGCRAVLREPQWVMTKRSHVGLVQDSQNSGPGEKSGPSLGAPKRLRRRRPSSAWPAAGGVPRSVGGVVLRQLRTVGQRCRHHHLYPGHAGFSRPCGSRHSSVGLAVHRAALPGRALGHRCCEAGHRPLRTNQKCTTGR